MICAGGGGIPVMYKPGATTELVGVEAVIDKDLCSELLAKSCTPTCIVMLTDAPGVYLDWGKPTQTSDQGGLTLSRWRRFRSRRARWVRRSQAACRFVDETGGVAAIGSLDDVQEMAAGKGGTRISRYVDGIVTA